jgi:hypothetical protein
MGQGRDDLRDSFITGAGIDRLHSVFVRGGSSRGGGGSRARTIKGHYKIARNSNFDQSIIFLSRLNTCSKNHATSVVM